MENSAKINYNEELLIFMINSLRLNTFDNQFMSNLNYLVLKNKQLTSGQDQLFRKLINKYRKQFATHSMDYEELLMLSWHCKVIPSEPTFTDAYISIEGNNINFKSPFNRKFLNDLRENTFNTYVWHKDVKLHISNYGIHNLSYIIKLANKHFKTVNYCDKVQSIYDQILHYDKVKIWDPTLVKVNDLYLIAGLNSALDEALGDIKLNSDPTIISMMVEYGIKVDQSVIEDSEELKFLSSYTVEVDISDINEMVEWLKKVGCDAVYVLDRGMNSTTYGIDLKKKFIKEGIAYRNTHQDSDSKFNYPVSISIHDMHMYKHYISIHDAKFKKYIKLVNSKPIDIK